jgi:hypothetical protein
MPIGHGGILIHVLNLDTRHSKIISFMLRPLRLYRKKCSVLIGLEVGHRDTVDAFGEKEIFILA